MPFKWKVASFNMAALWLCGPLKNPEILLRKIQRLNINSQAILENTRKTVKMRLMRTLIFTNIQTNIGPT